VKAVPGDADRLPASAWSGDSAVFGRYLEASGGDYVLVGQAGSGRARVRFRGNFEGHSVVWDCHFLTLAAEAADNPGVGSLRNFIEIGEAGEHGVALRVGLALTCIDAPAIEKMIIMIRNYRNLRPGRHEYGEAWTPLSRE
jgi:hypothetical protein